MLLLLQRVLSAFLVFSKKDPAVRSRSFASSFVFSFLSVTCNPMSLIFITHLESDLLTITNILTHHNSLVSALDSSFPLTFLKGAAGMISFNLHFSACQPLHLPRKYLWHLLQLAVFPLQIPRWCASWTVVTGSPMIMFSAWKLTVFLCYEYSAFS